MQFFRVDAVKTATTSFIIAQMTRTRFGFLMLALLWGTFAFGQVTAPKYSNEFLTIGVGARALGMSNAQVASSSDVYSSYWNPAGLLGVQSDLQIGAMHAEYFAGIANYNYAGVAIPLDTNAAASISFIRFGVDDIPNTTELIDADGNIDYSRITSFSASDNALVLSYARKLRPKLTVGANVKVIYRQVGDFANAIGFGLDASAIYKTGPWAIAAMARDVTSTFNAWSFDLDENTQQVFVATGNEIPQNSVEATLPRLILGASRTWFFNDVSLLAEVDLDVTTDGKRNVLVSADPVSVDPHAGFEVGYKNRIFLRGGIGNVQQASVTSSSPEWTFQPNLGIGLKIKEFSLDYALTDIGDASAALYSNIFSIKFNIWKS